MENSEEKEKQEAKPKRKPAAKKVKAVEPVEEPLAEAMPTESEEIVNAEKMEAETPAEVAAISEKILTEEKATEENSNAETNIETIAELPEEVAEISVTKEEGVANVSATNDKSVQANDFVKEMIARIEKLQSENNFRDFWFYVKELQNFIFSSPNLKKDQRNDFKKQIGEICVVVKTRQEEMRIALSKTSIEKKSAIDKLIADALAQDNSPEGIEISFKKIEEAQKLWHGKIETGTEHASFENDGLTREDRDKVRDLLKSTKDEIFGRKRATRQKNFEEIAAKLREIGDKVFAKNPREAFNQIKKLRTDMRNIALDRDHVKEIDGVINALWKKAGQKIDEKREHETVNRVSGMENLINKNHQFIKRLEKEIEDIKIKWADVQNDMFKNRMNEWIEEKTQKIAKVQEDNKSLTEKIKFLREKESKL